MTTGTEENIIKKILTSNAYLISAYSISIGSIYLWAYWSHFDVNILEYIAVSDIIKFTAFPVLYIAIIVGISVLIMRPHFTRSSPLNNTDQIHPVVILLALLAVILFLGGLVYLSKKMLWIALSLVVSFPFVLLANRSNLLRETLGESSLRRVALYFLVLLPFLTWGYGRTAATNITTGRHFTYLISNSSSYPASAALHDRPRLIGIAGGNIFVFIPDRQSILVSKMKEDFSFEFKRHSAERVPLHRFGDWVLGLLN